MNPVKYLARILGDLLVCFSFMFSILLLKIFSLPCCHFAMKLDTWLNKFELISHYILRSRFLIDFVFFFNPFAAKHYNLPG